MIILAFPWALSLLSCPCWRTPDQTEVPWRKGKYPAWGNENTGFRALGCKCLSWPSHASRDTQFHRYIYIYVCVHMCVHFISSVFVFKISRLRFWKLAASKAGPSAPSSSSQLWLPNSSACSRLSFLKARTFGRQLIKAHTRWVPVQSNSRYDEPIVYMNRPLRDVGMKPFLISYLFRTLHAVASVSLLKFCWFFIHLPRAWHI